MHFRASDPHLSASPIKGNGQLKHETVPNSEKYSQLRLLSTSSGKKMDFFAFDLNQEPFSLHDEFIAKFQDKQPDWGPLGLITYKRTYARTKSDGVAEEFWETLRRVVEGTYRIQQRHCQLFHLPWYVNKAQRSAQRSFELMWNFKFLPPGRGLWIMGTDIIERIGGAALSNCSFVSTNEINASFSAPFTFLMDMSMLGVGVGGDCRGAGLISISLPLVNLDVHTIEDSREGWIGAVRRLLEAYVGNNTLPSRWDYNLVRPAGAPIRGFGGVAAGPEPLRKLLENDLPGVLNANIGKKISSTTIVDIFNFIGKCVVSGNVRRSAEILFSSPNDKEFLGLKDPEKHAAELQDRRWASNNSVFADVGMDYKAIAAQTIRNGEPGLFWLDNARNFGRMADPPDYRDRRVMGANPCIEQCLESYELCTLVESFPSRHDTYEEYEQTLKHAYLYAKTVTLVPTHDQRTNAIQLRNRRIGTSQSGITDNFARIGRRKHFEWSDKGYKYLRDLDRIYSEWLCVPTSNRITSVKPSGTVSLLPGVSPGIHYPIAQYYIRRIRIAEGSPLVTALARAGYRTESCTYTPNTTVVEFPVHEKNFTKGEADVNIWEQMENAAALQKWWADNAVSVTIKFDPKTEASQIIPALELFEDRLKSISFLPKSAHGYKQAPYEEITAEVYAERIKGLCPVDLSKVTNEVVDKYCDGAKCII